MDKQSKQSVKKVPVTERALFQRINRKLGQQANPEQLRTANGQRQEEELGRYYVVESGTFGSPRKASSQGVVHVDVDLEKFGRDLGVLRPWEELAR